VRKNDVLQTWRANKATVGGWISV
ncbi:uncharacterized protein METZ01_LOCUS405041, partial [marine metagenome]